MIAMVTVQLCVSLFIQAVPSQSGDSYECRRRIADVHRLTTKTVLSQNAEFLLEIIPEKPLGSQSATYTLSRRGLALWTRRHVFALSQAVVCNTGHIIGAAFTFDCHENSVGDATEYLDVVILNPEGGIVLRDRNLRRPPPGHFNPPAASTPTIAQIVVDCANGVAVVRVVGSKTPWWVYNISEARLVRRFSARKQMFDGERPWRVVDAYHIPETPLLVVQWCVTERRWNEKDSTRVSGYDWDRYVDDARFSVIDYSGATVWQVDAPRDYESENLGAGLYRFLRRNPALLKASEPGMFCIRRFATGESITYRILKARSGTWDVAEVERIPFGDDARPGGPPRFEVGETMILTPA